MDSDRRTAGPEGEADRGDGHDGRVFGARHVRVGEDVPDDERGVQPHWRGLGTGL
jgi:hypothetical protein